jgi:hypothetical protein
MFWSRARWRELIETEVGQDLFRLQPVIRKYALDRFGQKI